MVLLWWRFTKQKTKYEQKIQYNSRLFVIVATDPDNTPTMHDNTTQTEKGARKEMYTLLKPVTPTITSLLNVYIQ